MMKKLLVAIVGIVAVVLAYATTRPDSFSVQRTLAVNAPPERIYPHLVDFHAWDAWSPWAKLDPAMKTVYGGAATGVGATYEWTGNSDVGSGRMEITDVTPNDKVTVKLDFLSPMESHNTTVFELTPKGGGTEVRWTMSGPSTYLTKLMTTFVSMDKMVGKDFEKGLQQLKQVAEQ